MKVQWNKLAVACALALVASTLVAADLPRSEWLSKVGDCANDAAAMSETMANVSAADQVALVSEVNAALAKMPGKSEARAAAFVKANAAALTAAMRQNKEKRAANQVLAEIYATVPPEYLPAVSEQLAKTVLKRGDLSKEVFITISTNSLHAISERSAKAENGGVREAFAAVTFLKALGEPASKEVVDAMLSQMSDAKTRETAAAEWIGPAMGQDGMAPSYDPMLGAANAGDEPDAAVVAAILAGNAPADAAAKKSEPVDNPNDGALHVATARPQNWNALGVAMLADLQAEGSPMAAAPENQMGGALLAPGAAGLGTQDIADDISLWRVPRAYVNSPEAVGGGKDGPNEGENPYYTHKRGDEAGGEPGTGGGGRTYRGQRARAW